jgi:hypothetical protein
MIRFFTILSMYMGMTSCLTLTTNALIEYERKHARVAMLAFPALELLSANGVDEPVRWLSTQPVDTQLMFFATAGILEAGATLPRFEGLLNLKNNITPGQFTPLGPATKEAEQVEVWIGRTVMIITFAWLVNGLLL